MILYRVRQRRSIDQIWVGLLGGVRLGQTSSDTFPFWLWANNGQRLGLRRAKRGLLQQFSWGEDLGVVTYAAASWSAKSVTGFHVAWFCHQVCEQTTDFEKPQFLRSWTDSLDHRFTKKKCVYKLFRFLESENPEIYFSNVEDFMQRDIEEIDDSLRFELVLVTDAMSAYQVMIGDGFSRRVRHLDIGIGFLQLWILITQASIFLGCEPHMFYFPFHIWDVILPIDELHHFSRWLASTTNQITINHH